MAEALNVEEIYPRGEKEGMNPVEELTQLVLDPQESDRVVSVGSVIPAIFACIINMIFPIMTWLNLDSLGQNSQPSDWTFFQSIASFH